MYVYHGDGTFVNLIVSKMPVGSFAIHITGKFSMKDGVISYYDRTAESSSDGGKTWRSGNPLADDAREYVFGSDEWGQYMLVGLEGESPPLDPLTNAVKYRSAENIP